MSVKRCILVHFLQNSLLALLKPVQPSVYLICFGFLMVFFLCIDIPDIVLILFATQDILDGFKGRTHGMVYIVIAVLTVTSHTVEIVDGL